MRSSGARGRVAVPVLVLIVAAGVRLWGLATPTKMYWDEQYYVFDAEVYLGGGIGQPIPGAPAVKIADEGTWVHPPLGKWIIALLGVGPIGDRSIGWRMPSAIFGIAGVGLLYALALQLWGSVWWAGMSALLLALDGLHVVQSRIAMLDIFLTTFITAGMLLLVLDRHRMDRQGPPEPPTRWVDRVFGSPFRLGAGAALGAAVATKWSGAFALAFAATLCAAWLFTGDRRAGRSRSAAVGTIVASFVLMPLLVYLISYGSFFYQHGFAIHDFMTLQTAMLRYQQHHTHLQPQNSLPWTWPFLLHPIQYFALVRGEQASRIVALGNPILWWGFLGLLPIALYTVLRHPRWEDVIALGGYSAMYLPWLLVSRTQFIYYMLPAVPFMCLCVPTLLRRLPERIGRAAGIAFAAGAAVAAAAYLPAWTGWTISTQWIDRLRLLPHWPL